MAKHGTHMILNGDLVPFADAKIHCLAPGITYAANAFEGLRAYWNAEQRQLFVFRLDDHLDRLQRTMKIMRFDRPYDNAVLKECVLRLLRANGIRENVHLRLHVYVDGDGSMTATGPLGMFISCVLRGEATETVKGVHAAVSSWTRLSDNASPPRVKVTANYHNGRLAALQAKTDGYDYPIMLTERGLVAEGPGACLFLIRDGVAMTPDVTQSILESITRETLLAGFREWLGGQAVERPLVRTELYLADEAFFCGTGQEVRPILSIDRLPVGDGRIGPLTAKLQQRYFDVVSGRGADHPEWRTAVYE